MRRWSLSCGDQCRLRARNNDLSEILARCPRGCSGRSGGLTSTEATQTAENYMMFRAPTGSGGRSPDDEALAYAVAEA